MKSWKVEGWFEYIHPGSIKSNLYYIEAVDHHKQEILAVRDGDPYNAVVVFGIHDWQFMRSVNPPAPAGVHSGSPPVILPTHKSTQPKYNVGDWVQDAPVLGHSPYIYQIVAVDLHLQEYHLRKDGTNPSFVASFHTVHGSSVPAGAPGALNNSPPPTSGMPPTQSSVSQQLKAIYAESGLIFDKLRAVAPGYNEPVCECGGEKTYGKGTDLHSTWCPKYVKH